MHNNIKRNQNRSELAEILEEFSVYGVAEGNVTVGIVGVEDDVLREAMAGKGAVGTAAFAATVTITAGG
jgi:hypothetical protein